jgi:nicotinamidase-related amidase
MKTAFIGMDYIFDIVHPDGKLSRNSSQVLKRSVIAKVNRLRDAAERRYGEAKRIWPRLAPSSHARQSRNIARRPADARTRKQAAAMLGSSRFASGWRIQPLPEAKESRA